jgi:hypothetical protein
VPIRKLPMLWRIARTSDDLPTANAYASNPTNTKSPVVTTRNRRAVRADFVLLTLLA